MDDLSLHILDIVQNSLAACATLVKIYVRLNFRTNVMSIRVLDDGRGMTKEQSEMAVSTNYTTRKDGLGGRGLPLLKATAEAAGGELKLTSKVMLGTEVTATFSLFAPKQKPLGNLAQLFVTLMQSEEKCDYILSYSEERNSYIVDSRVIKKLIGEEYILSPNVLTVIEKYINENIDAIKRHNNTQHKKEQTMKSLAELTALRDEMKNKMGIRHDDHENIKIIVGMATGGIAAGAKHVLASFVKEVSEQELTNVTVTQSGQMVVLGCEPLVEVKIAGKTPVTYINVSPDMAKNIVSQHIVGGTPVKEYIISTKNK